MVNGCATLLGILVVLNRLPLATFISHNIVLNTGLTLDGLFLAVLC